MNLKIVNTYPPNIEDIRKVLKVDGEPKNNFMAHKKRLRLQYKNATGQYKKKGKKGKRKYA